MDIQLPQCMGANLCLASLGETADICHPKSPSNKEGQGTEIPVNGSSGWYSVLAVDLAQPENPTSSSTQPQSQNGNHVKPGAQSSVHTARTPNQQNSQPRDTVSDSNQLQSANYIHTQLQGIAYGSAQSENPVSDHS